MNKSGFIIIPSIPLNTNGDLNDEGVYYANWSYLVNSINVLLYDWTVAQCALKLPTLIQ